MEKSEKPMNANFKNRAQLRDNTLVYCKTENVVNNAKTEINNDESSNSLIEISGRDRVFINRILNRITVHKTIDGFSETEILSVLAKTYEHFKPIPTLVNVEVPVIIFGDIHGQLADLQRFLQIVDSAQNTNLLFLGDYVDRCNKGIEVALLLFCYKLLYPERINLLRGNHECSKMNRIYGFYYECRNRISVKVWKAFQRIFDELPLCARVGKRILAMHGGISPSIENWDSLINLRKPRTSVACDEGICLDLMWADPSRNNCVKGFQTNTDRGTSYIFSDSAIENFNLKMDIDLVVRAHEVVKNGHLFNANNQMCTIFSAPNYCGLDNNRASVMRVSKTLEISFVTLKPKTRELNMTEDEIDRQKEQFLQANAKSPTPGGNSAQVTKQSTKNCETLTKSEKNKNTKNSKERSKEIMKALKAIRPKSSGKAKIYSKMPSIPLIFDSLSSPTSIDLLAPFASLSLSSESSTTKTAEEFNDELTAL